MKDFGARGMAVRPEQGIGAVTVAIRDSGKEVVLTMSGDGRWLGEKRSVEEMVGVLEAAHPDLPRVWLHELAEAVQNPKAPRKTRVRCAVYCAVSLGAQLAQSTWNC